MFIFKLYEDIFFDVKCFGKMMTLFTTHLFDSVYDNVNVVTWIILA